MDTQRRHRRLIRGGFQSRFLTVSLVHYLAIVLTFAAVVFFPLMVHLDDPALVLDERVEFANQFLSLHQRVWPALLVVLVLLVFHLVYFSHRFAGPLHRCRQVFQHITNGDFTCTTTVRKGDLLHEEVSALNDMVSALRANTEDVKTQSAQVRTAYADLEKALAARPGSDVARRLRALNDQLTSLETSLRRFRTAQAPDEPESDS